MIYSNMAQITPRSVVDGIAHLLSKAGYLKGEDEAVSLLDYMRESTMLFQKAIYLSILRNTSTETVLNAYLVKGGWDLLNTWLTEAKKSGNTAIALEILQVLKHLPVTLVLLKQGNMGKVVKNFTKVEDREIKKISTELLDSWMKVVKDNPGGKKKKSADKDEDPLTKRDQLLPKKGYQKSAPLAESLGFLDAITSSRKASAPRKVRKRSSTDGEFKRSNSLTESTTPTSEVVVVVKPPKVEIKETVKVEVKGAPRPQLSNSPPPLPDKSHGNDNMFCFRRAKKRRRIRWRVDLEDIQLFECEDSDRVHHKSFADSMLKEYEKERMAVLRSRQLGDDSMVEMVGWKHPLKLEGECLTLAEKGASSKERDFQRERERNVLAVLIFDQNARPDSPQEPDHEEAPFTSPTIIPLSDQSNEEKIEKIDKIVLSPPQVTVPVPEDHHQPSQQQLPPVLISMIQAQHHQQVIIPQMLPLPALPDHTTTTYQAYNPLAVAMQRYPPVGSVPYNPHFVPTLPAPAERFEKPQNGSGWFRGGRNYQDWYDTRGDQGRPRVAKRRQCAFYKSIQGCRSGANCMFLHDDNAPDETRDYPDMKRGWDDRRDFRNRQYHHDNKSENRDRRERDEKRESRSDEKEETEELSKERKESTPPIVQT